MNFFIGNFKVDRGTSSAEVERGFSELKYVKYDRRGSLVLETTDAQLRIRSNGPSIDRFNAYSIAKLWNDGGQWHYRADQNVPGPTAAVKEIKLRPSNIFI